MPTKQRSKNSNSLPRFVDLVIDDDGERSAQRLPRREAKAAANAFNRIASESGWKARAFIR